VDCCAQRRVREERERRKAAAALRADFHDDISEINLVGELYRIYGRI
jgi:hypothetical protein